MKVKMGRGFSNNYSRQSYRDNRRFAEKQRKNAGYKNIYKKIKLKDLGNYESLDAEEIMWLLDLYEKKRKIKIMKKVKQLGMQTWFSDIHDIDLTDNEILLKKILKIKMPAICRFMTETEKLLLINIKQFKNLCRKGIFTKHTGHGYYATKEMVSNIEVEPEDFIAGYYRTDFHYICWHKNTNWFADPYGGAYYINV